MAEVKKRKQKRLNILIMRPGGGARTFSVSPLLFFLSGFLAIVFCVVSIVVMHRYFVLYLEHGDLVKSHQAATVELIRLQGLYSYQNMVNRDYAKYVYGDGNDNTDEGSQLIPVSSLPLDEDSEALDLLESWAAVFPDPVADENNELEIIDFEVEGGDFKFKLINEAGSRVTAQGFMLLLFTVLNPGDNQLALVPYPDFDPQDREPDFISGVSYNTRTSKVISGSLPISDGARLVEMMAVAKSKDGEIVLKQKMLTPVE